MLKFLCLEKLIVDVHHPTVIDGLFTSFVCFKVLFILPEMFLGASTLVDVGPRWNDLHRGLYQ